MRAATSPSDVLLGLDTVALTPPPMTWTQENCCASPPSAAAASRGATTTSGEVASDVETSRRGRSGASSPLAGCAGAAAAASVMACTWSAHTEVSGIQRFGRMPPSVMISLAVSPAGTESTATWMQRSAASGPVFS